MDEKNIRAQIEKVSALLQQEKEKQRILAEISELEKAISQPPKRYSGQSPHNFGAFATRPKSSAPPLLNGKVEPKRHKSQVWKPSIPSTTNPTPPSIPSTTNPTPPSITSTKNPTPPSNEPKRYKPHVWKPSNPSPSVPPAPAKSPSEALQLLKEINSLEKAIGSKQLTGKRKNPNKVAYCKSPKSPGSLKSNTLEVLKEISELEKEIAKKTNKPAKGRPKPTLRPRRPLPLRINKWYLSSPGTKTQGRSPIFSSRSLRLLPPSQQVKREIRTPTKPARPSTLKAQKVPAARNKTLRKKKDYCVYFNKLGKCTREGSCLYLHDPKRVAVCLKFLRGECSGQCTLRHQVDRDQMPTCMHFLEGICSKEDCPYAHVGVSRDAPLCPQFLQGYCPRGRHCPNLHSFVCPEWRRTGICSIPSCRLYHAKKVTPRPDLTPRSQSSKRQKLQLKEAVLRPNFSTTPAAEVPEANPGEDGEGQVS